MISNNRYRINKELIKVKNDSHDLSAIDYIIKNEIDFKCKKHKKNCKKPKLTSQNIYKVE